MSISFEKKDLVAFVRPGTTTPCNGSARKAFAVPSDRDQCSGTAKIKYQGEKYTVKIRDLWELAQTVNSRRRLLMNALIILLDLELRDSNTDLTRVQTPLLQTQQRIVGTPRNQQPDAASSIFSPSTLPSPSPAKMLDVTDAKFSREVKEQLQSIVDAACNHRSRQQEYFKAIAEAASELAAASSGLLTNVEVSPRHFTYIILIF